MAERNLEAITNMTMTEKEICRKVVHLDVEWSLVDRAALLRRFFRVLCNRFLVCSVGKPSRYRRLPRSVSVPSPVALERALVSGDLASASDDHDVDPDLVSLKISVMGDCQIGKTSFVTKYVGDGQEQKSVQMEGLNLMNKVLFVRGARIGFSIWDVGGDHNKSLDHVPLACTDAAAIFFMFDLTSRCTLNSVLGWYRHARKWNRTAVPVLIGTKFDDFVDLPLDLQWTIVSQARDYARAMKATLFFSSATHNINVNKVFKFITAKLFNLPWTVERNLTVGEPIIDF
ncbi:PREDICTED: septum-promoting GTP-binding protein 1-like [Nelumbo nucifera]|uniref:Septum-promoting GTP-binding protein 1-like n=1 Tax=Nelumbo nucifera TaxID=4432 RepID=A0A1U8AJ46_NELNU|nr:PREDICTED: septum-promoting GTP-binding protein 1-like [Nelumbo nucifera]